MTNVCDSPHAGGMEVIAAGTGTYMHFQYTQRSELRLRQASFVTIDSVHCLDYLTHKNRVNPDAIICAHVNGNDQAVYTGDSGISIAYIGSIHPSFHPSHLHQQQAII